MRVSLAISRVILYLLWVYVKVFSLISPMKRSFIEIDRSFSSGKHQLSVHGLRILQFNTLADGLSGLRSDMGGFSRVSKDFMTWNHRKTLLLSEIMQYDPDIITLQECDHYYDFFYPSLSFQGYEGIFAPKPASSCLEVSDYPDGCAVFYKTTRLKMLSCEVRTNIIVYCVITL